MHNTTSAIGREDGEALSSVSSLSNSDVAKINIRPTSLSNRGQNYSVFHDGRLLIEKTRNPTADACRLLVSRGRTGRLEVWDDERPYPRLIIRDLVTAAGLTISESEHHGPRFRPYRPIPDFCAAGLMGA